MLHFSHHNTSHMRINEAHLLVRHKRDWCIEGIKLKQENTFMNALKRHER